MKANLRIEFITLYLLKEFLYKQFNFNGICLKVCI